MKLFFKNNAFLFIVVIVVFALFYKTFLFGLLPIPSDTIIGLYHPFRDLYATEYPNGIPFKNFLITDPVRQIIPWKMLVVDSWRQFELPLWNPYEMSGKPLLANFQSGAFYPLNILLFITPFSVGWTIFIMSQQLLGAIFFYLYSRNLKLSNFASAFGALVFVFSGFFIAWLQWGNVIHTLIWLPLILLCIDKISIMASSLKMNQTNKKMFGWTILLTFALAISLFAGHLQTHIYVLITSIVYAIGRMVVLRNTKLFINLCISLVIYVLITAIQWLPTLQYILLSARGTDQVYTQVEGWFIPLNHLIQFVAPDFFGNPTTLNYWGVWNYGEMVGYVGIFPLFFALYAICNRNMRRVVKFFAILSIVVLIAATDNRIAELPYSLSIPFLSSAQPTRMLAILVFCLAILASFGVDKFLYTVSTKKRQSDLLVPLGIIIGVFAFVWITVITKNTFVVKDIITNVSIAQKNLLLPSALLVSLIGIIGTSLFLRSKKMIYLVMFIIFSVTVFDLFRFAYKFLPFTPSEYLFPQTPSLSYLEKQQKPFRIATLQSEIMPPNFSTVYKLESVSGYDPLYTQWYARYVTLLETNASDPLVKFNRVISPKNLNSSLLQGMNTRYFLSKDDLTESKLKKVFTEGSTNVYENLNVLPRTYFVKEVQNYTSDSDEDQLLSSVNLLTTAIVNTDSRISIESTGSAAITQYTANTVEIETSTEGVGFLVLSDSYYPTWKAYIDQKEVQIYRTNGAFRGVVVPAGTHTVQYVNTLF